MTAFDIVALLVVLVSGLIGFARGAVREVVTLVAFGLAAGLAILALPHTAPVLRHVVHPAWAAAAAAVVVVFVLIYVLVRVGGGWVARKLHAINLGGPDRALGAGFGVVRALVALGLFFLVFQAATRDLTPPRWIVGALTWPVARACGHVLDRLAPSGARFRDGMGRTMGQDVKDSFAIGANVTERDEQAPGIQFGGDDSADSLKNADTPDEDAPGAGGRRESKAQEAARHRGLEVKLTGGHARHHHSAESDR